MFCPLCGVTLPLLAASSRAALPASRTPAAPTTAPHDRAHRVQPSGSRGGLRNVLLAVTLLLGGSAAAFAAFEPGRLASSASGDTTATDAPPPQATAAEPVGAEAEPKPLTEEQKCVDATVAYGYVWADYSSAKITRYFLFGQEVSEYEHFRYRQQGNNADPSHSAATQRTEFDPQWKARLAAIPQLHPLSDSGQEVHLGKFLSASGSESTYVAQAETLCREVYPATPPPVSPEQQAQDDAQDEAWEAVAANSTMYTEPCYHMGDLINAVVNAWPDKQAMEGILSRLAAHPEVVKDLRQVTIETLDGSGGDNSGGPLDDACGHTY